MAKSDECFTGKLVALGWKQREGFDCAIFFARVCRLDNQRLPLIIAAANDWRVVSRYVQSVFLNLVLDIKELKAITINLRIQHTHIVR